MQQEKVEKKKDTYREPSGKPIKQQKALSKHEQRKAKTRISEIEKEVGILEAQQAELSTVLENPPANSEEVWRLGEQYVALSKQVDLLMAEWANLEDKLED